MRDEDELRAEQRAGAGLRLFGTFLGIGHAVLLIATVLAVPFAVLAFSGEGTFTLDAEIAPPYAIEFTDGRAVEARGGSTAWSNMPREDDEPYFAGEPSVQARVDVDEDDDARLVMGLALGGWFALFWLGLVNVRRIVRAALDGRPFDASNVGRLRWLAVAVFGFPAVSTAMAWALEPRLDVDLPVRVVIPGPSWWVFVIIGTGVLALAEIFREGSRLRVLEETTI